MYEWDPTRNSREIALNAITATSKSCDAKMWLLDCEKTRFQESTKQLLWFNPIPLNPILQFGPYSDLTEKNFYGTRHKKNNYLVLVDACI